MMSSISSYVWLLPAVPLVCAFVILFLPNELKRIAGGVAIAGQLLAFVASTAAFIIILNSPDKRAIYNFVWFTFGDQVLQLGWLLDPLAAVMLVMITLVGSCIFVFSLGYMEEDKHFVRFFAYLSFFSGAMLALVIANSLLLLFISWELVGVASYLLIGFWIERPSAAAAAKKAFITTRIGDLALFFGMLWLYHNSGTLLFYNNGAGCLEKIVAGTSTTAIALLIFGGAVGKSGQFPLHVWLPDAMEGPTPVSALIHAATMVAAGVFLVARVYPIFEAGAVNGVTASLTVVVWIGVITGLMAALIAAAQFDIKRILAYSTVSQLGLMMVSLGVGGVTAGIAHLLAHGFFKALLFLGAGSVIHSLHHEQDIRRMGGLRLAMPVTFLTYAIGMMALSGVPLFFSGAWTKEEILAATSHWPVSPLPYYLTMVGIVLTAFYMTRQVIFVFFGKQRATTAHESPKVMTLPLAVLAFSTIAFSLILTPAWPWLYSFLTNENSPFNPAKVFQPVILLSLLLVAGGITLGVLVYRNVGQADPLEANPAFRFLENRVWLDELYQHTILAISRGAALLSEWMDRYVWDGAVRMIAGAGQCVARLTTRADEAGINKAVDEATAGARGLGQLISLGHSGQVQRYLAAVGVGMLALLLIYAWLA